MRTYRKGTLRKRTMHKLNYKTKIPFFKTIALIAVLIGLEGCAAMVAGTAATGVMVAQDRRTTGTMVEDKSIEVKAFHALNDLIQNDSKAHVSAVSYNNRVLLVGQAPTEALRSKIEDTIRRVAMVRHLHNEVSIAAPTSMLTRSSDAWITAKIKGEMLVNKDINPTRVKVITEDGIVYLMGLVTPNEERVAVDVARHTKGVKKVIKIFEYIAS